jgi:hypothetical protein
VGGGGALGLRTLVPVLAYKVTRPGVGRYDMCGLRKGVCSPWLVLLFANQFKFKLVLETRNPLLILFSRIQLLTPLSPPIMDVWIRKVSWNWGPLTPYSPPLMDDERRKVEDCSIALMN